MAFKSNDRTFEKVYGIFDKRDYFNAQGLAKTQIGNFERALQRNDKGAQQILDKFKGDMGKAKDYITQVITDRKKEDAFNQYKAFKAAVDSIQKGKPIYGAVDLVKSRIHNSSQKYTIALYSALRNKKFTKWKDVHDDVDSLIGESVNEDKFYNTRVQYTDPKSKKKFVGDVVRKDGDEYKVNLGKDGRFEKYILAKAKDLKIVSKSTKRTFESVNEGISVFDERHFGKKGIIIMIDDNGKKVSAIFKDKKNADKFNRNNPSDIKKLLQLAKKTKFPKAIDESTNEGKKRFKRQDGIGKAKYTISYHDGKKKHKDGSDFFDIKIFKNKKDLSDFVGTLVKQGYKLTNESINEKYSGNSKDFKYDLELALDKIGISYKAIKKISKKGKGFEVRMSSYMKNRDAWEKLGKEMGAKLVDFQPGSINIGLYESKKEVEQIANKTKSETAFYDVLSKIEKKYGKRNYRIWLEKSLKDLGVNAKHYDYRTNAAAEEKLYQLTK